MGKWTKESFSTKSTLKPTILQSNCLLTLGWFGFSVKIKFLD